MATVTFNRDELARWYASRHLATDPDVQRVIYLPSNAPEREIRFIEVSDSAIPMTDDSLEPLDFGMERGTDHFHTLVVLDVSEEQWHRMIAGKLALPAGWSLSDFRQFTE